MGASEKVGDEKSIVVVSLSSVDERKVHIFEKIIIDPSLYGELWDDSLFILYAESRDINDKSYSHTK